MQPEISLIPILPYIFKVCKQLDGCNLYAGLTQETTKQEARTFAAGCRFLGENFTRYHSFSLVLSRRVEAGIIDRSSTL